MKRADLFDILTDDSDLTAGMFALDETTGEVRWFTMAEIKALRERERPVDPPAPPKRKGGRGYRSSHRVAWGRFEFYGYKRR